MTEDGKLSLLQLAPRLAADPTNGAELRMYHLACRLARHMRVTHVGFVRPERAAAAKQESDGPRWIAVPRHGAYRPFDLVRGAVGGVPFSVLNYTRPEMTAQLRRLLAEEAFDIVQLESIHLAGYLRAIRGAPRPPRAIVCDWHNIESEVLHRYSDATSSLPRRLYARHAGRKLERYEREFVAQCDLHLACSPRDAATLRRYNPKAKVVVVENGVDARYFADIAAERGRRNRDRVLFVGAMDYHANIDGAGFFARKVWPQLASGLPKAVFTIVGRNPAAEVRALANGERIEVTGTVADVRPYYAEALMAVVPLRVGGGTRLKILEAMAAGVPVVSTALGAEGLSAEAGRDYVLADSAGEMARAVLELAGDPGRQARLSCAGLELVARCYDWAALGDVLAGRLTEMAKLDARLQ